MRERGLKFVEICDFDEKTGRSREGAWIEIESLGRIADFFEVAPVRERGLKLTVLIIMLFCLVSLP